MEDKVDKGRQETVGGRQAGINKADTLPSGG